MARLGAVVGWHRFRGSDVVAVLSEMEGGSGDSFRWPYAWKQDNVENQGGDAILCIMGLRHCSHASLEPIVPVLLF